MVLAIDGGGSSVVLAIDWFRLVVKVVACSRQVETVVVVESVVVMEVELEVDSSSRRFLPAPHQGMGCQGLVV